MEIEVHVIHYLVISTVMLFCGIYGFFTRKNLLALLISAELMLNATNINAVAIAIIINVYRNINKILTDDISEMKG